MLQGLLLLLLLLTMTEVLLLILLLLHTLRSGGLETCAEEAVGLAKVCSCCLMVRLSPGNLKIREELCRSK
jgi:hypothetical protein